MLDLGKVSVVAEVTLNGKNLGVYWLSPYSVDITEALVSGPNKLEIRITNQWTNRLIGDLRFPATDNYDSNGINMPDWYINNESMPPGKRTTFTTYNFYNQKSKLISAGLLGPVKIIQFKHVAL